MSEQAVTNEITTHETKASKPQKALRKERPRFKTKASEDGLELSVLLPGVTQENLTVDIENRLLTINGTRSGVDHPGYGDQADEERVYQLRVNVHDDFDTSEISAKHQHGILSLTLKKRAEIAKRQIDILAN